MFITKESFTAICEYKLFCPHAEPDNDNPFSHGVSVSGIASYLNLGRIQFLDYAGPYYYRRLLDRALIRPMPSLSFYLRLSYHAAVLADPVRHPAS